MDQLGRLGLGKQPINRFACFEINLRITEVLEEFCNQRAFYDRMNHDDDRKQIIPGSKKEFHSQNLCCYVGQAF